MEIQLDRPRRVAKVSLDPGNLSRDQPRGLRVEGSLDGRSWREIVSTPRLLGGIDWLGRHPRLNPRGKVGVWFGPTETRYLRLTQIGRTSEKVNWTIAELVVHEEAPEDVATPEPAGFIPPADSSRLQALLAASGVEALYSTDEGNIFFTRHLSPRMHTVTLRDRMWEAVHRSERVVKFERPNGFFLPTEAPLLVADFRRRGLAFERHRLPSGVLYVTPPQPGAPPLYWDYGRLLGLDSRS